MKSEKNITDNELFVWLDIKAEPITFYFFEQHNNYEIYLLDSGERDITINDKTYKTKDCDVALIKPGEPHKSTGNTPYSGLCIQFSEQYIDRYFSPLAKSHILNIFSKRIISLTKEAADEVHRLANLIKRHSNGHFIYLCGITDVLRLGQKKSAHNHEITVSKKLSPIIDYINENFLSIKNLEDLVNVFYLSKTYICNTFKKETGQTVIHYINGLKIDMARTLLSNRKYSIASIAGQCGFESTARV